MSSLSIAHAFKVYKPEVEGGIPGVINTLSRGLPQKLRQRIVVTTGGSERVDTVDGVPVVRIWSAGTLWSLPLAPKYPWRLAEAANDVDLLVLHAPFPLADCALLLPRSLKCRILVHWHADIVRQRIAKPLYRPLVRHTLQRADLVIVSSDATLARTPELLAVHEKVRVIPYGIDPAPWTAIDDDRAAIEQLRREPPFFLAIGRLVTYKGFDLLIRAAAKSGLRVRIAGTGAEDRRLRSLIEELGVGGSVSMDGFVPHRRLRQMLHAARALVLPSVTKAEAFGLVQVEAMFCGCAVINTALPTGVPWVVRHEQEALTVEPYSVNELAGAMLRLQNDEALARRLGSAGRDRAFERFTADAFCAAVQKAYLEALQMPRGA